MLVGGMVYHQLGDYPEAPAMGFTEEDLEVAKRPVSSVNVGIV